MAKIFISYKRTDKKRVFEIKDLIESETGERCWIDLYGIESDAQFINVIINAINEAEVVLFMYSKAHMSVDYEQDWTIRELNFAHSKQKRIVFVNIDNSPLTDHFAFMFGIKQQVNGQSSEALHHLISDLKKWLNMSAPEPSAPGRAPSTMGIFAKIRQFLLGFRKTMWTYWRSRNDIINLVLLLYCILLIIGMFYPIYWIPVIIGCVGIGMLLCNKEDGVVGVGAAALIWTLINATIVANQLPKTVTSYRFFMTSPFVLSYLPLLLTTVVVILMFIPKKGKPWWKKCKRISRLGVMLLTLIGIGWVSIYFVDILTKHGLSGNIKYIILAYLPKALIRL